MKHRITHALCILLSVTALSGCASSSDLEAMAAMMGGVAAATSSVSPGLPSTPYCAPTTFTGSAPTTSMQQATCSYCKGNGKNPTDNLSAGVPTFGNDQGTTPCYICGRTVQKPHIHGPCPICHGTGHAG